MTFQQVALPPNSTVAAIDRVRTILVWLTFAASFVVKFEPAPTDIFFVLATVTFLTSGLQPSRVAGLLGFCLLLYNLGCLFSYLQVMQEPKTGMFVVTSVYMSFSALLLCMAVAHDPEKIVRTIVNGWIFGAVIASLLGIMGAFDIAGTGEAMSLVGRARGLFKDPNVLATYLELPIIALLQRAISGRGKFGLLQILSLAIMSGAEILAFSRGAWISVALSGMLVVIITFAMTPDPRLKTRVMLISVVGMLVVAAMTLALFSIPAVADLAAQRLSFNQSYDVGETGRFGNQINSIPLLLERPLGFGPLQFSTFFDEDPHNTFLNAFASYGWLGGLSYIVLVVLTVTAGMKVVFLQGPYQHLALLVFCPLLATILQGVQIDTDHWRHFYWMLGMMWGLVAATLAHRQTAQYP